MVIHITRTRETTKKENMPVNLRMVKLSTPCREKATDLKGMVTHAIIGMDQSIKYLFQPRGTNPEDGQPLKRIFVGLERLIVPKENFEDVEIPFEILGTQVTDKASRFTGMAIEFVRHTHGCFHVMIQPKGILPKTGLPVEQAEFDLRQCEGPMISKLSEEELARSKKKNPSPTNQLFTVPVPNVMSGAAKIVR